MTVVGTVTTSVSEIVEYSVTVTVEGVTVTSNTDAQSVEAWDRRELARMARKQLSALHLAWAVETVAAKPATNKKALEYILHGGNVSLVKTRSRRVDETFRGIP
jgi:ribosomal protein S6